MVADYHPLQMTWRYV